MTEKESKRVWTTITVSLLPLIEHDKDPFKSQLSPISANPATQFHPLYAFNLHPKQVDPGSPSTPVIYPMAQEKTSHEGVWQVNNPSLHKRPSALDESYSDNIITLRSLQKGSLFLA